MDDQLLTQLNRLIDGHHEYLCGRLDDLSQEIQAVHAVLLARLETHEQYHRQSEHRWGVFRLVERHPFRFMTIAFMIVVMLTNNNAESGSWIKEMVRWFIAIFK